MTVDPQTLGLNLSLIIGGLICLVGGALLIIALLTGGTFLVWSSRRARAEAALRRQREGPDGAPLPPASRGICTACSAATEVVYHLEDGRRLCRRCLELK